MTQEGRPQQDSGAVVLVYEPTVRDMASALSARMRATPAGRRTRRLLHIAGGLGISCFALLVLVDAMTWRLWFLLGLGLVAFGCLYLLPQIQARQLHQMAARQGEFRAVVDDGGIRLTSRDGDATSKWGMYSRYAETDDVFVLLTGDKHGVGLMVLPKRGAADTAAVERLRTLLTTHLGKA
ncbi:YcxB family protein [Streptomyces peucetius]|uniref:YcxB family protein n=1 Tax=Streptomyces peucetius TaxID=1950 RepID=A0ABY6I5B9_STRPE|nr:YcxB family protein [Streptomyces peucetius]UYQ62031.1 YcxB family protein [Streptomyces peucetius]